MSEQTEGSRARGIDRAIELLECLHAAREPLRIGDLARRLKAPRSTTYEIVNRFLEAGILESYDGAGRVFFGRTVHFYAADYLGKHGLTGRARDEVERLAQAANETAQFCALHGNKYTVVHMRTGTKIFRISSDVGVVVPIPWTASGRLLLDHMSREEIARFVPAEDFVLPSGRKIDVDAFCDEVRQARAAGYAVTTALVDDFTHCMAAPVRNTAGIAVGCVCFVVTNDKTTEEKARLLESLRDSAARLSDYLTEMEHSAGDRIDKAR